MNDNEHGPLHFSREVPRKVKISCHQAVKVAVDDGLLLPEPCSVCGTTLHVKAHHDDYAKPLDVIWLCQSHHALRHNQLAHASSRIGGKRPNQTGRPTRAGAETTSATVRLTASERAELTAALRPGESLAALLRDGGLRLARERAEDGRTDRERSEDAEREGCSRETWAALRSDK